MRKKLFVVGVLSLLSIFQSCNNGEEISNEKNSSVEKTASSYSSRLTSDSKTLSGYVANILATQTEIKSILDSESNANFAMIQSGMQNVKTIEDLELLYRNANITHIEELISLYKNISTDSETFSKSNPEFYSRYTDEERLNLLTQEIDSQLGYSEAEGLSARTNCHAVFMKATRRCMRNYAIEIAGSVAVGVFTGGIGGGIAAGIATVHMIACNGDADIDYHDCVEEGGQP